MEDFILNEIPTPELFVLYIPTINHVVTKLIPNSANSGVLLYWDYTSEHVDSIENFNDCYKQLGSKLDDTTRAIFHFGIQTSDGLPPVSKWLWVSLDLSDFENITNLNWRSMSILDDWGMGRENG